MFQKLCDEQKSKKILALPAQFGIRHRGRSVCSAREVMNENANESGLGAFVIGSMLLTHPERLEHYEDLWKDNLWIDCPGDEFAPFPGGDFSLSPCFEFSYIKVKFIILTVDFARNRYSSPSMFLL